MENKTSFTPNPDLKLLDQVRQVLRYYQYSYRTEQSYTSWILNFLRFYRLEKHPKDMGRYEVERYLSYLATERQVSKSTQRLALNALAFLYKKVLLQDLGKMHITKSTVGPRIPVVMTRDEVRTLVHFLTGTHKLMAQLLYGCGLRLMECHRLRVKDVDFGQSLLYICNAKGGSERAVSLPTTLEVPLKEQVQLVAILHITDLENGFGEVFIPPALLRKYPNSCKELGWQYLFPGKNISTDPQTGTRRRHHVLESGLQKAIKRAAKKSTFTKRITAHTFRHSYATHLLEDGINIRVLQNLLGHRNVKTTEVYTHVVQKDLTKTKSPLDTL